MAATARLYQSTQFFDSNGDMLASGTINTYQAGTSTNKATYSNRGKTVTNANPIVLDSQGRAQIWLDTDQRYKFIIKDSSGTTLETIDDLTGVPEALSDDTTTLAGNLDVSTFSIVSASNRDIAITPNGSGDLVLDGLKWPQADGTNGQVLSTNGSGQLSWATSGSGSMNDLIDDLTPQLGGVLDTNAFNIQIDNSKGILDDSSNEQLIFTKTASAVNYVNIANNITSNDPIISAAGDDTNIGLSLQPKAGGNLILDAHTWPNSDGTANQVLQTNGSGVLSWATSSTGKLVNFAVTTSTTAASTTSSIPSDTSIPQNTEGSEYFTVSITPTKSTNRLIIKGNLAQAGHNGGNEFTFALFQDSTADAIYADGIIMTNTFSRMPVNFTYTMIAGTTSSTTFKLRYGQGAGGTAYIGSNTFGGTAVSSLIVEEWEV